MYTRNHEHSTNVCYYLFFSVCFLFWFSLYFWLLIKTVVSDVQAFKQPKYNKNNDILSTNMFFGVHAVEHIDWIVFGNGRLLFLRSFWATTITSVNDNNERMKTNILLAKWMLCVHIDFRRGALAVFYLYSVLYYYYLLISVFLVIVDVFFSISCDLQQSFYFFTRFCFIYCFQLYFERKKIYHAYMCGCIVLLHTGYPILLL